MASTSMVKNLNKHQVIECMRDDHTHTKQELALKTGLSFPTVGKLIDGLVKEKKYCQSERMNAVRAEEKPVCTD